MLMSAEVADRLVEFCDLNDKTDVLEIGSGRGILTERLARLSRHVLSFEIDHRLFGKTSTTLKRYHNLELVCGDAFLANLEAYRFFGCCVTSLPYSQSLRFAKWLALNSSRFSSIVAIVQKEFAQKINSPPGIRSYRSVSVIVQLCFEVVELFTIPRACFDPPPKVGSTAVRLVRNSNFLFDESRLRLIDLIFSFRGRRLAAALKKLAPSLIVDPTLENLGSKRIEELSPVEYQSIIPRLESELRN